MGNRNTNSKLRKAFVHLSISADHVSESDDEFWLQIWSEDANSARDAIDAISTQEVRMLRDSSPRNFALLAYKCVERICQATGTLCNTSSQQTAVLNAVRVLIKLVPCFYESKRWLKFFERNRLLEDEREHDKLNLKYPEVIVSRDYAAYLPADIRPAKSKDAVEVEDVSSDDDNDEDEKSAAENVAQNTNLLTLEDDTDETETIKDEDENVQLLDKGHVPRAIDKKPTRPSLMRSLVLAICDLLFCPEFTVTPHADTHLSSKVDAPPEDIRSLIACDYVWEPGVGFDSSANSTQHYDKSRVELLKLLLACFSCSMYTKHSTEQRPINKWVELFASQQNRHTLPLFTSLLNTILAHDANSCSAIRLLHIHLGLVKSSNFDYQETRAQLVQLALHVLIIALDSDEADTGANVFVDYMSRIHRDEDFTIIVNGFHRLLSGSIEQNYSTSATSRPRCTRFEEELLIMFWRFCNSNKRFLSRVFSNDHTVDIALAMLYHLNDNMCEPNRDELMHVSTFNLFMLSGERMFGVRLNKPYTASVLQGLPAFTGSHADLMIVVFHKLIMYGENLQPLYNYLLTILVNISPYVKSMCTLSARCLVQLYEIFSAPAIILTEPSYHQLLVFLLEIFNNTIQYQFDGNAQLVYAILLKRDAFMQLARMPTSQASIQRVLDKLLREHRKRQSESVKQCDGKSPKETETLLDSPRKPLISGIDNVLQHDDESDDQAKSEAADDEDGDSAVVESDANNQKWKPTSEWLKKFKRSLPLATILRMIEVLAPQLDEHIQRTSSGSSEALQHEAQAISILQNGTLVGLLPVPHAIVARKYKSNSETALWFRKAQWRIIASRHSIWRDTRTRLISLD